VPSSVLTRNRSRFYGNSISSRVGMVRVVRLVVRFCAGAILARTRTRA